MAGEDPGVGTLAVILELIQRTGNAVTSTLKSGVSFGLDVIKTGMFFAWRRQMMNAQKGPDLVHGYQSLKKLRLHEQVGATITSAGIGDKEAMKALKSELKRLKIDFAITDDGKRNDKQYTLHYKKGNEQDVMLAQAAAMQKLYGSPDLDAQEYEQESARSQQRENEEQQRNAEQEREQARQQQQETQNREPAERAQSQDRQQDQDSNTPDEPGREASERDGERTERAQSIGAVGAGLTASQALAAHGVAKAASVDELQQRLGEMKAQHGISPARARTQAQSTPSANLDELKATAKQRAQEKNAMRKASRKQSREHNLSRTATRTRSRSLEMSH